MADDSENSLAGKTALAAAGAIGSAAIAAALLYAKRRKDRKARENLLPAPDKTPNFPAETD